MEILTHPGFIGGCIGALFGTLGGSAGIYFSLKHAETGAQKRAIWRFVGLIIFLLVVFLIPMIAAPSPYKYFVWLPYLIAVFAAVIRFNRNYSATGKTS